MEYKIGDRIFCPKLHQRNNFYGKILRKDGSNLVILREDTEKIWTLCMVERRIKNKLPIVIPIKFNECIANILESK